MTARLGSRERTAPLHFARLDARDTARARMEIACATQGGMGTTAHSKVAPRAVPGTVPARYLLLSPAIVVQESPVKTINLCSDYFCDACRLMERAIVKLDTLARPVTLNYVQFRTAQATDRVRTQRVFVTAAGSDRGARIFL